MANPQPHYDLARVKQDAAHHWAAIINRVAGIGDDFLTENHGPCPKCGGGAGADRWRVFGDFEETGGAICNQCGKFGDGIALIQWYMGIGFLEAKRKVAEFLGTSPEAARGKGKGGAGGVIGNGAAKANGTKVPLPASPSPSPGSSPVEPEFRTLELLPPAEPSDTLGLIGWCDKKRGLTVGQVKQLGGRFARYRKRYVVIAFPVNGPDGQVVGWTIYEAGGGMLPHFEKGSKEVASWLKVKTIKAK